MTDGEADEHIIQALKVLSKHFDHVQILATWEEGSSTHRSKKGFGNWYARQGLAQEFISQDRARDIAEELKNVIPKEPPDEGDSWKESV